MEDKKFKNCVRCGKKLNKLKVTNDWNTRHLHKKCHRDLVKYCAVYDENHQLGIVYRNLLDYRNFEHLQVADD